MKFENNLLADADVRALAAKVADTYSNVAPALGLDADDAEKLSLGEMLDTLLDKLNEKFGE